MLRRLGRKTRILPKLLPLFPECSSFIDLFFGSGAVSFAMVKRCKYIIANDLDNEVFNLYQVLRHQKDDLIKQIQLMPIHNGLWQHWKKNEESEPVFKAVRFLFRSNFGYMGRGETLRVGFTLSKQTILQEVENVFLFIQDIQFINYDFREVLSKITYSCLSETRLTCNEIGIAHV